MLRSSVWGFVCAIAIVSAASQACSSPAPTEPFSACDPDDATCKSAPVKGGTPSKDAGTAANTAPKNDAGGAVSSGDSSSSIPTPTGDAAATEAVCATTATGFECGDCCASFHQAGAKIDFETYGLCACETPGACKTECGATEFCKQGGTQIAKDDACDKCLTKEDTGTCGNKAKTACDGNPDCVAFIACLNKSTCNMKK